MRILRQGVKPGDIEYKHTCRTCRTVFGYYSKDVKQHFDQREGSWNTCQCPYCNASCSPNFKDPVTEADLD